MAWVGIILLVIAGAIALVLSARADRRTKVPHDASEAAASTDEDAAEPEPIEGTEPEPADAEPATVSEIGRAHV